MYIVCVYKIANRTARTQVFMLILTHIYHLNSQGLCCIVICQAFALWHDNMSEAEKTIGRSDVAVHISITVVVYKFHRATVAA